MSIENKQLIDSKEALDTLKSQEWTDPHTQYTHGIFVIECLRVNTCPENSCSLSTVWIWALKP